MDKREFIREFITSDIKLYDTEGDFICKVNTYDISAGGVLLVSSGLEFEKFDTGDEVNFILTIPTGEVSGTAEVIWVDEEEYRMGLKFKKILKGASNLVAFIANGFF